MKTISILSQKGGSGKTTLALHLAVMAEEQGKRAVVIDLDPQASATLWHTARTRAGHPQSPHVQPTHPAGLESVLNNCAAQGVDFVFIDTAPQSDNVATQAAQLADLVLIACKPSILDLRAIQNTLRLTEIARVRPYVVLTQIEAQGTRHAEAAQTLANLKVDVLPAGMGKRVAYMDALIDGQAASEFEPHGRAAEETRLLFDVVAKLAKKATGRRNAA
ncbi:ParA family protein [Hoeflea sp. EC-HK425]|uniref:ParA family protein n=1 Tax=Hoeflea sp. EC-HK425 TaxID=2038388 RepID=UPI001259F18E|nr:ParA family protein [Hoeflea sp. EC-HK425]VVS99863.1 Chromosome partitioning protein ParA [Hoeflea sp. EC-HK425]